MAYSFFKLNIIPLFRLKTKKVEGLENIPAEQNFIMAANHNSWFDPVYVVSALTKIIKKKIFFVSGTKKYSGLGVIPINQKNKAKTVEKALHYLKKGKIVFLFIEGRSNPTKILLEPKTGAARLALKSGLPVIPLGVSGNRGSGLLSSLFWELLMPRVVKIKVGKPLFFNEYYQQEKNKINLKKVSNIIIKEISKLCGKKMPQENYL